MLRIVSLLLCIAGGYFMSTFFSFFFLLGKRIMSWITYQIHIPPPPTLGNSFYKFCRQEFGKICLLTNARLSVLLYFFKCVIFLLYLPLA